MMLPNSAASKLAPREPKIEIRAMPRAKDAVVMTPIAASAPMRRLREIRLIASAEPSPHTPAPR